MTNSLKIKDPKTWVWTSKMVKEYNDLKLTIKKIESLRIIDYNAPLILRTDAYNFGLGAVLLQKNEKNEYFPIEWASKKLTPTEKNILLQKKK